MKGDDRTLEVEVTIVPPKRRKGGQRSSGTESQPADAPQIPRIARLMALAIKFQEMVDRGEVRDYADLARLGYVTRARLTQIMNLLLLAPDIQAVILSSSVPELAERHLRTLTQIPAWEPQRRRWRELLPGPVTQG